MLSGRMIDLPVTLHVAAAARDAVGVDARPGAVAVRDGRIVASGTPDAVRRSLHRLVDREVDHGAVLILPGFVNAHAHLDLAGIGTSRYRGDFAEWAMEVAQLRPRDRVAVTTHVRRALEESRASGIGWIGDIAGSEDAVFARCAAVADGLPGGISWLECFGIGLAQGTAAETAGDRLLRLRGAISQHPSIKIELSPHAPYSAGRALYACAASLGAPSTHLSETLDELRFVRDGTGPFAELLRSIGKWDTSITGDGCSPVQALAAELARAPWVLAHCNHLDDYDVELLASWPSISIAYCPVASDYFGHRGHRYRELLHRGVNVCLGTDSILCQPAGERQPHGILAQVRHLRRRDGTDPLLLLDLATRRGARALQLGSQEATLTRDARANLFKVPFDADRREDAWQQVLDNDCDATAID